MYNSLRDTFLTSCIKAACSDPQSHPQTFLLEVLIPEVESYLTGFMCEMGCTKSV